MTGPRRTLRWLAIVAAAAAVGVWGVVRFIQHDHRSIAAVAAPLLGCSPEQVEVISSDTSDTGELYRVRGCGRDEIVVCNAPDFICALAR